MLRFYILCSRNTFALRRHLNVIPAQEQVVVINTLDKYFESAAVEYCKAHKIEYYVTESDGTAPTGKNCLYHVFRGTDDEYMVMLDGDDFITRHGYLTYKQIVSSGRAPDVLALSYQYGFCVHPQHWLNVGFEELHRTNGKIGIRDPETIPPYGFRPFMVGDMDFPVEAVTMRRWHGLAKKYISPDETHHRVTMVSKKAVDGYHWPDYRIGEDTLLYLQYKDAMVRGELTMAHHPEHLPTYVYDTRIDGVCAAENDANAKAGTRAKWLNDMLDAIEAMEFAGQLHELVPPTITPVFPDGYQADALNLPNLNIEAKAS